MLIWLVWPARADSRWKLQGPFGSGARSRGGGPRRAPRATPRAPTRGDLPGSGSSEARRLAEGMDAAARRRSAAAAMAQDRARRGPCRWPSVVAPCADRPGNRGGQGGAGGGGAAQGRRLRGGQAQATSGGGPAAHGRGDRPAGDLSPAEERRARRGWCATSSARSRATRAPGARGRLDGPVLRSRCEINPPSQRPIERDLSARGSRLRVPRDHGARPEGHFVVGDTFDATVNYRTFRFTWARVCRPPGEGSARFEC